MSEINVPSVTIPQLHKNLTTLSRTDIIPIVQGSELDRDAAVTLSEILASDVFMEQKEWKTFKPSNGTIDTGTWAHNSLVLMQAWANDIINIGSTIKDAVMLVLPKWGSTGTRVTTSCTFTHNLTTGEDFSCAVPAGNLLLLSFGADAKVSEYACIPMSANNTNVVLNALTLRGALTGTSADFSAAVNALSVNAKSVTVTEGTGAVPSSTITDDGLIVTDGAMKHTDVSASGIDSTTSGRASHFGFDKVDFSASGTVETGTKSSEMDESSSVFEHEVSSTSTAGINTTRTRTCTTSAESVIVEETNVTIDPTTTPIYKVTALTRITTSPEGVVIYAKTTTVQVTFIDGIYTEVAGTTTTDEATSSFKIGELDVSGNLAVAGQASVVGDLSTAHNLLAGGKLTVGGSLITPYVQCTESNVDLSTAVVDRSMVYGQHLFVINAGSAEITVTGKVMSGAVYLEKTWTLAIGTMCDFVAVPVTGYPNAIAKLG